MKYVIAALRPSHWVKNVFIFLPLLFAGKLFEPRYLMEAFLAFVLFSMAASAVYLANDIWDLEKDRLHPTKRLRPIASRRLQVTHAVFIAVVLGACSVVFSFYLSRLLALIIIAYLVLNAVYSKVLKNAVIIDVFCIALFFVLRIMAGSVVTGVVLSPWIIVMTALLALFLGFNKRRQELKIMRRRSAVHRPSLGKYSLYFIDQMVAVITPSVAVAYMLYTIDARTIARFGTANLICTIPFVYYGIFRYLYIIHKRRSDGDPVRVLLTDKMIVIDVFLWASVCAMIIYM